MLGRTKLRPRVMAVGVPGPRLGVTAALEGVVPAVPGRPALNGLPEATAVPLACSPAVALPFKLCRSLMIPGSRILSS